MTEAASEPPGGPAGKPGRKPAVSESILVARAQGGDPRAFEQIVRQHQQSVYSVALRILGDPDEAEDAAQNAFVAAWRTLPEFRADAKLSTWLYRIVTNQALNQSRARSRAATPADTADLDLTTNPGWMSPPAATDPEEYAQRIALIDAVRAALAGLPEELRVCWVLREIENCPYQEVADITQVSLDTARGRIYRARLRLAEAMSSWR